MELTTRQKAIAEYGTGPAHWLREVMDPAPEDSDFLCMMFRVPDGASDAILAGLDAAAPALHIPPHERARLARLASLDRLGGASLLAFVRVADEASTIARLRDTGLAQVVRSLPGSAPTETDADTAESTAARGAMPGPAAWTAVKERVIFLRAPVLGIIDDEIGYLNTRFCTRDDAGGLQSRVQKVWVQHRPAAGATGLEDGPVVTGPMITSMLDDIAAGRLEEGRAYERFRPGNRRLAAVTHGTHVMDLAAGFDPDQAPDIPIFAVDMPACALEAPAARRGTSYLVQGIRWLVQSALDHIDAHNTAALIADDGVSPIEYRVPDIVLSCSIGSYAGPKDGTGLFAELVGEELDLVAAMRTPEGVVPGYDFRATLFQSFGNAYAGNQSAMHPAVTRTAPLDWVLPRQDRDASLLELRVSGAALKTLWLRIGGQDFEIPAPKHARYRQITKAGEPVCRIYRESDETGGRALYSILVRPTAHDHAGTACAPAGPVRLVADLDGVGDVTWQVERDDVPFGYDGEGRQSWLEDPVSHGWNPARRAYDTPGPGSAILREGTETAQANSPHPSIVTVGAAIADDPAYPVRPSPYSASGSNNVAVSMRAGPDVSATGDDSAYVSGVLASGTVSGSVARLSGTSVAAPQAARRMLLTGTPPQQDGPSTLRSGPRFEDRSGARDARIAG